jgi:putative NADH-flavin reductase
MKIALIGATGFVGSALLAEALDRGHRVSAVMRQPAKLPQRVGLTGVAADLNDVRALATARWPATRS